MFQALALPICYDEGLMLEVSALETLHWTVYIINFVDKTKLSCYTPPLSPSPLPPPPQRNTTVSLETIRYQNFLCQYESWFNYPEHIAYCILRIASIASLLTVLQFF